ncbi:MAG: response regulator, partial [Proteobacteria bacterium]|nr:response regulator [Pseudomonadota bacterium]
MIIEDSAPLALACTEFLKTAYVVSTADDLAAARSLLETAQPDALILDIQLPDGSGLDFLAELREQGRTLPIIVMTSDGSVENAVAAMQGGADDFLEKPFSAERLRTTVS